MKIIDRLTHAWDAFKGTSSPPANEPRVPSSDIVRNRYYVNNKSQFASAIFNRIALDAATTSINHIRRNSKTGDIDIIHDGLNYCLNVEANIDQTGIAFMYDLIYSMLEEGKVAAVPVEWVSTLKYGNTIDIKQMRVGQILGFTTKSVQVRVYSEKAGRQKEIWLPKDQVAIIENPLYNVVNAPNSTLTRLLTKMTQLDMMDLYYANNRLDLILQMPVALKTDKQIQEAKKRIEMIEEQLTHGHNGVVYIDATEKITQVNRPANSQLTDSIDKLKSDFFNQLGMTQAIFDGTATEPQLRQYYNRTIDAIIMFIVREMERKFLSKTARTQGHELEWYRDILKFVSAEQIINLGDTFRRNEIATSNEIRSMVGLPRSTVSLADDLANPNIRKRDTASQGVDRQENQNDNKMDRKVVDDE